MLVAVILCGAGSAWGEKITDYSNIVSGKQYYIGATTGSNDYYLSVNGTSTSTSTAGTAVSSKANATAFTFSGSGTSWTIKFESGYYLSLKSSKDNGKVQVVENASTFTASNQSGKIRLSIGNYSVQKNSSGTQFGSYGNTQTDIWLEEAATTPAYSITAQSNNTEYGTVTLEGTTITANPEDGYQVSTTTPYTVTTGTAEVEQDGNLFYVTASSDCTVTINFEEKPTISGYTIDFESALDSYVDWTFENVANSNTAIDAHGGSKYGANINASGNGVESCSIKTKETIALPGTFTCYVSKVSTNTTASTWSVEVSSNGSDWTTVDTHSATSMTKGSWDEFTTDLSQYSNVYVRLSYGKSSAIRAVDDISLTMRDPNAKTTPTVTIDATGLTTTDIAGSTNVAAGTITATVTSGENTISTPAVTWSSSNTDVATVNETTGAVTLIAVGTTTITASFAGNDDYNEASETYELTVTNSLAPGGEANPYTVAQAIEKAPTSGTSDKVYIRGIVSAFYNTSIMGDGSNYRYYISDDGTTTNQLVVYKGKGLNDVAFTNDDDLQIGDIVTIYGGLNTYNNAAQVASGNYIVSLTREKQDPTIGVADASVAYGSTYTINEALINGGDITVTSGNTAIATVNGLTITPVAVGSVEITVATAENDQYNAGSQTFTLTVTAPEGQTTAPTASEGEVFFHESFNQCEGAGGNDDSWSGSIANNDIVYDITGWETDNGKGANKCAKFGTGKAGGYLITPALGRAGDFILTFKAAAWNTANEGTTLSLSTDDTPGTLNLSEVTLVKGQWSDYTVSITGATAETKIMFYTDAGNHRVFLDEVKIEVPATEVEDITVSLNTKGYATYCSQYPLDFTNATDYTAWAVTSVSSEGAVTFSQITGAVMGGVGVLLKGADGATVNLSSTNSNNVPDNRLIGTLAPTYIDEVGSVFGLSGDKFVKNSAVGAVRANKAYLPASVLGFMPIVGPDGPEGIKMLTFVFEGADGVKSVERISANEAVEIFNIAGQRVSTMQRGVNIVNGKKVLVK